METIISLKHIVLCSMVSMLCFFISVFVPPAALFVMLFLIAPYIMLSYEQGAAHAVASSAISAMIICMLVHPIISVAYFISFGISGSLIGRCVKLSSRSADAILGAISISIVCKLASVSIVYASTGINILLPDPSHIEDALTAVGGLGITSISTEELSAVRSAIPAMIEHLKALIPSTIVLFSAGETLASIVLVSRLRRRRGEADVLELPRFSAWSFPKNILLVLLAGYVFGMVSEATDTLGLMAQAGTNLSVIARVLFVIQGLAVACFFMEIRGFPKAFRVAIIISVLLISFLGDIFSIVGILDLGLSFRQKFGGQKQ